MSIKTTTFFISRLFISVILLSAIGCSLSELSEKKVSIELVTEERFQSLQWKDDLNQESLENAIQQSIQYYKRLPKTRFFQYEDVSYTAEEMIASLQLFMKTFQNYQGQDLVEQLQQKFLFYESKNSNEEAFFTGYYEPILLGSLTKTEEFKSPLFVKPMDLINVNLELFGEKWKGQRIVGKVEDGNLIPYDSRDEIVYRQSLETREEPMVYVQNDIELFFLQIQGSGLVQLPDGSLKRVNYAAQNGHAYKAIGRLLLVEEKILREEMSLQSIKAYLYEHPEEVKRILNYNQSYTFFRDVEEGPLGNIEVPLTPERSIAMDHKLIPKGGLAFISTTEPIFDGEEMIGSKPITRFVLIQDTGGAIYGHGRADIFWGNGEPAEKSAGHMRNKGHIYLVVAKKEFLETSFQLRPS